MSTLQIGLAIAGGLAMAAVVAHGAWSARKVAPRQAQPRDDGNGTEPPPEAIEPRLEADDFVAPAPPMAHSPAEKKPGLDALIDVIAPVALETEVHGEAAIAALPSTRRVGSKPFAVEGLNNESHVWEAPMAGQRYAALQAGVQLANRSGALNEIEFSEFIAKTQAFCDAVGGTADFPDMLEEVARARELDQFASGHDAQLGFTLRARSAAWSPGYVQQQAARLGFVAGAVPGRMVLPAAAPGLPPVLSLLFDTQAALAEDPAQAAVRQVSLALDVAQVDRSEQPFVRLREVAQGMAQAMDGVITDDNGQILPKDAMDAIGGELEGLYDTLEQRDLAAGSALARRLFS
ncbi:MAG: cell division protein ZipA C-terminal FtsZ-binding domain-containing protein [Betaproteobacteria bacterium]